MVGEARRREPAVVCQQPSVVRSAQFGDRPVVKTIQSTRLPQPWRTSNRMTYESSSAASDVILAPFGLPIIRAMQPSAARGETAESVANQQPDDLRKQQCGV